MIPYEIAWPARNGDGPEPCRTKKHIIQRVFYEYSDSELTDETWETALVMAVVAMGEFVTPKTNTCGTLTRWDSNAWWWKNSWRKKINDGAYVLTRGVLTSAKARECWNENGWWLLEKRCVAHGAQDWKRGSEGHASEIVLRTREPRAKPKLWRTKKRGNTHPG